MSEPKFKHYDLSLVEPNFGSALTNLIIELDVLRNKNMSGTTPANLFFQLKAIFHMLESVGSARIEGNNTTIAEYIETKIEKTENAPPLGIKEIDNINGAMNFIDQSVKENEIDRLFVYELHKRVVDGLPADAEGDATPGKFRTKNPRINKSNHVPPHHTQVEGYMNELFLFMNKQALPQYDLLKVAIAHHRFMWIHPFGNGNGRTGRLFTYAMLIKLGFKVDMAGRILNPTAVFCVNRNDYYKYLALADSGKKEENLQWCEYVLKGLKEEIEKVDRLTDYSFLSKEILLPSVEYSLERKIITEIEFRILKRTIEKRVIKSGDLKDIFVNKASSEISRQIRKLLDRKMLNPLKDGSRTYTIGFNNNYLLRGIIKLLGEKGFLPIKE